LLSDAIYTVSDYNNAYILCSTENFMDETLKRETDNLARRLDIQDLQSALIFPKYFEIETIRACNARCEMCTSSDWDGAGNKMSEELFAKIASQVRDYSSWVNSVCLSRNGEPLLDKNIPNKIKLLKKYGVRQVTFSTNASLLGYKKSIALIESGLDDIRFSLDGITKETFESIRRGLNFDKVMKNCMEFIELRNQRGTKPRIQARMVLQEKNAGEEKRWKEFWLSKLREMDVVYSKQMHSWGNQLKEIPYSEDIIKYSNLPCISPWSTMVIHFDGKVPMCGCDYNNLFLLGDASKQKIEQIWRNENYARIRKIHSEGKRNEIPLCRGCNVWDVEEKHVYGGKA